MGMGNEAPTGRRTGAGFAACACAAAALAIAWWIAPEIVRGVRSTSWPAVEGTLLGAARGWTVDVSRFGKRPISQWLELGYAYSVERADGRTEHFVRGAFDASTPTDGSTRHPYSIAVKAMATEAMRTAPDVTVRYDPEDPSIAVLRTGIPFGTTIVLLPCLVLAGAAWLLARGNARNHPRFVPFVILFPIGGLLLAAVLVGLFRHHAGGMPPSWPMLAYEAIAVTALVRPDWCRQRPLAQVIGAAVLALPPAAIWSFVLYVGEESNEVAYVPDDTTIVAQLEHPHPEVAATAGWAVRDRRGPIAAIPALGRCLESPELGVRRAAVGAIEALGTAAIELAPRLERLAREDPDERCRGFAAQALRHVRG